MKKRFLLGLLVCVLVISLCGCESATKQKVCNTWYDSCRNELVLYEDGTGSYSGEIIQWSLLSDNEFKITWSDRIEVYWLSFQERPYGEAGLTAEYMVLTPESGGSELAFQNRYVPLSSS